MSGDLRRRRGARGRAARQSRVPIGASSCRWKPPWRRTVGKQWGSGPAGIERVDPYFPAESSAEL